MIARFSPTREDPFRAREGYPAGVASVLKNRTGPEHRRLVPPMLVIRFVRSILYVCARENESTIRSQR